jgi:hypothetical protein
MYEQVLILIYLSNQPAANILYKFGPGLIGFPRICMNEITSSVKKKRKGNVAKAIRLETTMRLI